MNIEDFKIKTLGKCSVKSPLKLSKRNDDGIFNYINETDRVIIDASLENFAKHKNKGTEPLSFEKAGPQEKIYFEPAKTKVAIVTCGGLCPGLNNVIRSLVNQMYKRYKVENIVGIRYGYAGFISENNLPFIELNPEIVDDIHKTGGTILGSSRGEQNVEDVVDTLERNNINILFTIGGDGTLRGAHDIHNEIEKRGLKISVAGIPKTIDNDICFIEKSFGFETAFTMARDIIVDAHNEAKGAWNGIALVKLMGRDSGFIAASAALAVPDVNFVIVPEMEFKLEGPKGFLEVLKERLKRRKHAVVVVAEGAGQNLFEGEHEKYDASGNIIYEDIGVHLKKLIKEAYKKEGFPHTIKYIDPSYIVRSAPANANDSKFCSQLAQNAVHAVMSGHTDFVVGFWNSTFTLLPIPMAVKERKKIDMESELWYNVIEVTGQPFKMA